MARLRKDTDLKALALSRYSLLMAKRNEIEEELKGLDGCLKAIGETGTKEKTRAVLDNCHMSKGSYPIRAERLLLPSSSYP